MLIKKDADGRYTGDFKCRRSGRTHYAPLKFWNNDRVVYGQGAYGAEIQEVVRVVKEEPLPLALRYKPTRRAHSTVPGDDDEEDGNDGRGCDRKTEGRGTVMEYAGSKDIEESQQADIERRKSQSSSRNEIGSSQTTRGLLSSDCRAPSSSFS